MKRYTAISLSTLSLLLLTLACSDELLIEEPPNLITAEGLFTSLEGFETSVNGLYSMVRLDREGLSGPNGLRTEITMNGTDNLLSNHRDGFFSIIAMEWEERNNPQWGSYETYFNWLYDVVNSANTVIGRAEGADEILGDNKERILAEAHFIRAWAYRYLVYMWGDVPITLIESSGSNIRTDFMRDPADEVWQQIIDDLLIAEAGLPVEPEVEGKATRGAAQHYLAEAYLVLDDPQSALDWADRCINTPEYELITERYGVNVDGEGVAFMDMFLDGNSNRAEGNIEALWVFQFENLVIGGGQGLMRRYHISRYNDIRVDGKTPLEITLERGGRPRARMSLTQWAIDNYEEDDDRASQQVLRKYFIYKDASQNDTGVADDLPDGVSFGDTLFLSSEEPITRDNRNRREWPFVRKWDSTDPLNVNSSGQFDDQVYLRLGETYLLKAEAEMKLGSLEAAAETLNVIRQRSNASSISADEVDLDFILDERSRELLVEEQRRFTLLRTGKWLERTRLHNTNGGARITERDRLFPIPQSVIDANLTFEMRQNPGYE